MIKGIGVDMVEIFRFEQWHTYSIDRLLKVFTTHEIEYSLHEQQMSAARFAARFAAKEAFYKALCSAIDNSPVSFAVIAPLVEVYQSPRHPPKLQINWFQLGSQINNIDLMPDKLVCHISITHTQELASAFVLLEE